MVMHKGVKMPGEAPPGVIPEVEQTGLQVLALTTVVLAPTLSMIVVGLRLYSRIMSKRLGVDDWWIAAASVLAIVQGVGGYICKFDSFVCWSFPFLARFNRESGHRT